MVLCFEEIVEYDFFVIEGFVIEVLVFVGIYIGVFIVGDNIGFEVNGWMK